MEICWVANINVVDTLMYSRSFTCIKMFCHKENRS